ncbi:OmpA/MotB family protein [Luxibacter massiliensis]|uniref:OmpA/MotB family protein n=1 Tax=Luxibacter massiliensis TaxID=2219695 RepID=UPI000F05C789|nr:flagellar motor protein MotB [Luxibacter massiliensis]
MKKRNKTPESGASWMDTYGDMVTLLLCFFVLLYSISSVDQAKWEMIVRSFNPDADKVSQIVTTDTLEGDQDVPGGFVEGDEINTFDELYENLKQSIEEAQLSAQVELFKGDGYTFVTFRDNVFFDGDSSIIKDEGKQILDQFANAISGAKDSIKEIQVLGHTTQADPAVQNDVESDRVLSAERAARVTAYIQNKSLVSPEKLVSVGYGQFRPIAPFDTPENRAKNRRVELLITKSDSVEHSLEEYYEEMNK